MKSFEQSRNRLIDIQQAAHITGISTTTLYKWVGQRKVPHIKLGRLVKFDPGKLDEWIKQQTVMPMPERRV
jgi:excisionase family DNA binding protein